MKTPCLGQSIQFAGLLLLRNMLIERVQKRVQKKMTVRAICIGWPEGALILIALEAAIDKVVNAIISAPTAWTEMIDCQQTTRFYLTDTAIATALIVKLAYRLKQGMHGSRDEDVSGQLLVGYF